MSDNRNAGFALSYAKDLIAGHAGAGIPADDLSSITIKVADEFLKWLDKPSMEDRIKNSLLKAGLKEINVSRVDVLDIWSESNGNAEEFITRIKNRTNTLIVAASH